ncbi:MAG TPA: hypothetical protein VHO25_05585, partial [Polyangiaceae bacterium]|nr:hypothetical protein [Polyangiaceae bacterium]
AASVVLEHELRTLLSSQSTRRQGLGQLLNEAVRLKLVPLKMHAELRATIAIRNAAVHGLDEPSRVSATMVLQGVSDFVEFAKKKRVGGKSRHLKGAKIGAANRTPDALVISCITHEMATRPSH